MKKKVVKIVKFFLIGLVVLALFFVAFSIFSAKLSEEKIIPVETIKPVVPVKPIDPLKPVDPLKPAVPIKPVETVEPTPIVTPKAPTTSEEGKENLNLLLLGSDARSVAEAGRSDTIILAGLDLKNKKINLMSFPRDLRVIVPGHANYGYVKLNSTFNSAYFNDGGPDLVIKTIETLVKGLTIDGYVKLNFGGFVKFVDVIGGIDYDVEKNMGYNYGGKEISLKPGEQHLDGSHALMYMRFRYDGIGDFAFNTTTQKITNADGTTSSIVIETEAGRVARQKKLIVAIIEQTKSIRNPLKLPSMLKALKQAYSSNFNDLYLLTLALELKNLGGKDVTILPFPASKVGSLWENGKSVSYVFPPINQQEYRDRILKYFLK